jgi:hypothetical protein
VLERTGLQFVPVNESEIAGWRSTIEGIYPALRARSDIDATLFDRLLELLSQYRGQAHAGPPGPP